MCINRAANALFIHYANICFTLVIRKVALLAGSKIILFAEQISKLGRALAEAFDATPIATAKELQTAVAQGDYSLIVVDMLGGGDVSIERIRDVLPSPDELSVPAIILANPASMEDKLAMYDMGYDDLIESGVEIDEALARCRKATYHQMAVRQLSSRLDAATATARTALVDNSDLGANVQFLLALHSCDNLDELGQQFFNSLERYGLKCSVQMRSLMGIKNMEPTGMAKDLESQLLTELKDKGRYIDFGRRTIINFDRVSMLIKNMPVDDAEKYGTIKDNTFALIQGLNARVIAIEDRYELEKEKETLKKLSSDVQGVMHVLKSSYQSVMKNIATTVEHTAEQIQYRIPALALTEVDEMFLEEVTNHSIYETNRIFNEGLKVDEYVNKLEQSLGAALAAIETDATSLSSGGDDGAKVDNNMVELF